MVRLFARFVVGVGVFALMSPLATAGFVMKFAGASPSQQIDFYYHGKAFNSQSAGPMHFSTSEPDYAPGVVAFCIDLEKSVRKNSSYTYIAIDLDDHLDPHRALLLTRLWVRFFEETRTAAGASAFQLATWEILVDGPGNLNTSAGNLKIKGTATATLNAANRASQMLKAITPISPLNDMNSYKATAFVSTTGQNQFMVQDVPNAVPAPGGLVLGAIGLVSLVGRQQVRRRSEVSVSLAFRPRASTIVPEIVAGGM
jgi:hypothetical protein